MGKITKKYFKTTLIIIIIFLDNYLLQSMQLRITGRIEMKVLRDVGFVQFMEFVDWKKNKTLLNSLVVYVNVVSYNKPVQHTIITLPLTLPFISFTAHLLTLEVSVYI